MTASIHSFAAALSTSATSFGSDQDNFIAIRSNIARDALKRASDFKSIADCIFESVANGYEAYNIGQIPRVTIEINKAGRDTAVVIKDNGVGMCSKAGLPRFFSLHLKTVRRDNGLNQRGYNGTGKIAAFKFANKMTVDTVKDGLRNVVELTTEILEHAAATETQPHAVWKVKDQPTDAPNGTTIVISKMKKGVAFTHEVMRDITSKIAFEKMMWMKNGIIEINGEEVVAEEIRFTSKHDAVSECGNFSVSIYHNEKVPYEQELNAVYMNAGRVFLARELFGMEGNPRFRQFLHVEAHTTEAWAEEHFYDNRERFVSESRDLKLKLANNPEAQAYADFVTLEVSQYIAELQKKWDEARKLHERDILAAMERKLSTAFAGIIDTTGGKEPSTRTETHDRDETTQTRERREKTGDANRKSNNISIEFDSLGDNIPYIVDFEGRRVTLNEDYGPLKAMSLHRDTIANQVASAELAADAIADLVAHIEVQAMFGDSEPPINDVLVQQRKSSSKVRDRAAKLTTDLYNSFLRESEKLAAQSPVVA